MKEGVTVMSILDRLKEADTLEKNLSSVISAMNTVLSADIRKQIDDAASCSSYYILNQALGEIQSCKCLMRNIAGETRVDMGVLNEYIE